MSGHSKWSTIKHKKAAADKKRAEVFGKILNAISIEARRDNNPETNPRLRSLIEKAKENNIPKDKIQNAILKPDSNNLEKVIVEGYGPGGVALIVEITTNNRNRSINEIKHIFNENGGKVSEPGSVQWIFAGNEPKFKQEITEEQIKHQLNKLIQNLNNYPDVQKVITNSE